MNKANASHPPRLAQAKSKPLRATFGDAPAPVPGSVREPLGAPGRALVEQLSGKLCLRMTARDFPHVINRLAAFGYQPVKMVNGIDALLIDDRPNRAGFPFAVVVELSELRAFYARLPRY